MGWGDPIGGANNRVEKFVNGKRGGLLEGVSVVGRPVGSSAFAIGFAGGDVVVFDLSVKGSLADIEHGGGGFAIAIGLFKGLLDVVGLDILEGLADERVLRAESGGDILSPLQFIGQIVEIQSLVLINDDHAFQRVPEFADVAGPGIASKHAHDGSLYRLGRLSVHLGEFFDEVFAEQGDVLGSFA